MWGTGYLTNHRRRGKERREKEKREEAKAKEVLLLKSFANNNKDKEIGQENFGRVFPGNKLFKRRNTRFQAVGRRESKVDGGATGKVRGGAQGANQAREGEAEAEEPEVVGRL